MALPCRTTIRIGSERLERRFPSRTPPGLWRNRRARARLERRRRGFPVTIVCPRRSEGVLERSRPPDLLIFQDHPLIHPSWRGVPPPSPPVLAPLPSGIVVR